MTKKTSPILISRGKAFKFTSFQMPNSDQKEDTGNEWIKWGLKNNYPNYLNKLFYESAYQSGIIRSKINYITGSGLDVVMGDPDNMMQGGFTTQDIVELICKDFELYNGFALRCVPSNDNGKKYFEHVDFDHLRRDKGLTGWWYSDNWNESTQSEEKTGLKFIPDYEHNSTEESIYVYTDNPKNAQTTKRRDLLHIYPEPVYVGGIKSIMTDIEIQKFHLHNILNGMKLSGVIHFPQGEPDNKSEFENEVQNAITPTENSGGILINYGNGSEDKVSFVPFTGDDLDKRYLTLEKSVVQNIMTAHCATSPMLFGIKTEGQLGGTTELEVSFDIFKRTYVRARQQVIEDHLNYLFDGNAEIKLNEPEPLFSKKEETNDFKLSSDEQSKEDAILLSLAKTGISKSSRKIISSKSVVEDFNFDANEKQLKDDFKNLSFSVYDIESRVLDLVRSGETIDSIIDALDDDPEAIRKSYANLVERGLISSGDITASGVRALAENQPDIELEVLYSYEKRPDVTGPAILPDNRTRDFCATLIRLNRLYTRQEIEQISQTEDRNVWLYRGGWYSDPSKPRPTPFCRHIWQQNLTVKR